jgi:hypothetical protein
VGDGPYTPLLNTLKNIIVTNGATESDLEAIAAETANVAAGVFRAPAEIIANGHAQNLSDSTDLMLIGAIVARYGMVMGNPFAGKE